MNKTKLSLMCASYSLMCQGLLESSLPQLKKERLKAQAKKIKQCLRSGCNQQHTHNNSFCSAECCKAWKAERHG